MIGQVKKLTMTKADDDNDWASTKNTIEGGGEGNPRGFARGKWFSNGIITHATENYSSA